MIVITIFKISFYMFGLMQSILLFLKQNRLNHLSLWLTRASLYLGKCLVWIKGSMCVDEKEKKAEEKGEEGQG